MVSSALFALFECIPLINQRTVFIFSSPPVFPPPTHTHTFYVDRDSRSLPLAVYFPLYLQEIKSSLGTAHLTSRGGVGPSTPEVAVDGWGSIAHGLPDGN